MSSRERLDMDNTKNTNTPNFKHQKGCFLQRWLLALLVLVAALLVLIVGLLVGYLTPCRLQQTSVDSDDGEPIPKNLPYVLLPRSVVPEHYDVELQPYIFPDNFTFRGEVQIQIRIEEATTNVSLHINDIVVDRESVELTNENVDSTPQISSVSQDPIRQFYILHLSSNLIKGQRYIVRLKFVGNLNDQLAGFYRSSYKDASGNVRWLATTQFQPTDARRAFPCFDEPALKATFNITIVRLRNMTSLSNMRIYKSEERGDNWIADYFESTVRMSTYLLAFIVSDFKSVGTPEFSVWSREEVISTAAYALEIGPKILAFYETFFNVKYPLPKMDMVAIPDFSAGAMENWGLITYRETALLYDERYSSTINKQSVASIIAHELAHQWFGNIVTPKWWDDLWLNEGFASYVEYLGVESVHPDWNMDQQFVIDDLQDVMELDCLKTSHPISVPVGRPDEINEIFDRISYGKGSSIIRMMKYFLGEDNLRKGLTSYLTAKKFDSAVQDDLWAHLTAALPETKPINVKTVMDSWTLQTGYPVVTIIRNYSAGTATVTQHRFLLERNNTDDTSHYQWEIPFTYTDGLNSNWEPETKFWLHKTNGSISGLPGPNFWIVGNIKEVGYYKVNYDEQNWLLLIKQLEDDHTKIDIISRAQILDDSLDLARASYLSYHLALNATLYLNKEMEFLPWKAALHSFGYIDSLICRSAIYGNWQKYLLKQLQPVYDALGWEETANENILRQYTRINALNWMCGYGHKDCLKTAQEKFDQWRKDPENDKIIPPNLRSVVYCNAVKHGGEEVWDFIWQRYKTAQIASQKNKFMFSLACAKEPWLLSRYLNWSLSSNSGIRRQDGSAVFRAIGSKLFGRDLTFNYLRDKWNVIFDRYGKSSFAISSLLKSVTSSLSTEFELYQLKEFYKKQRNKLGTARRAFEQSIEKAEANVRWMDSNYAQLQSWLEAVN